MNNTKRLFTVIVVLVFLLASTTNIFAAKSTTTYKTIDGIKYEFWSNISNNTPREIFFQTTMQISAEGVTVPTGYMGVRARLYSDSGTLKSDTGWTYNKSAKGALLVYDTHWTLTGYYYSKGQVKIFNGDGYNTYNCTATTNYSPSLTSLNALDSTIV